MKIESFIARRYLSSKNKPVFISILTWLSLAGMTLSVFALLFVLSIMQGFERDFEKRIIGFEAPLVIRGKNGSDWAALKKTLSEKLPEIQRIEEGREGEGILQNSEGEVTGVRIRGVSDLSDPHRFESLDQIESTDKPGLLLGRELAYSTGASPEYGDSIQLIFPFGEISPSGEMLPRVRHYQVQGTFRTGFYEYDTKFVLADIQETERLLGDYVRSFLEIWVEPVSRAVVVKTKIQSLISNDLFQVETWEEKNPKLFAALKLERIGMFLLLSILMLIASLTLFGLTSLTVMEKIRDMAVLRSLGFTQAQVKKVFLFKAVLIGIVGDVVGGASALLLILYWTKNPLSLPSAYYVDSLPLSLSFSSAILVLTLSPVLAALAAWYPSRQALQFPPAELLRYE